MPLAAQSRPPNAPTSKDLAAGVATPQDYFVEDEHPFQPEIAEKGPLQDLRQFMHYLSERGRRIRLVFTPKRQSRQQIAPKTGENTLLSSAEKADQGAVQERQTDATVLPKDKEISTTASLPSEHQLLPIQEPYGFETTEPAVRLKFPTIENSRSTQGKVGIGILAESAKGKEIDIATYSELVLGADGISDVGAEEQLGGLLEAESTVLPDILQGHMPPLSTADNIEFVCSSVMFKASGKIESSKLFYDTMSTDNWMSSKFVSKFNLKQHPLLPDDITTHQTINGDILATHYVELELIDKSRGMLEFDKVSFNVTPTMGGIGMLVGRKFIIKHNIVIDPRRGRDAYVTTSREGSAAAKEAKKRFKEQSAKDYQLAKTFATTSQVSTNQTPETSSSEARQVASSCTSEAPSTSPKNGKK
jgi:hypothetical protein